MSEPEVIDIWGDEGGMQLVLHRLPNGHVVVGIDAVGGSERRRLGEVTIARFRLPRIAQFLVPEETEEQHRQAVARVRSLIQEANRD